MFVKYEIRDLDVFQPGSFPEVEREVVAICKHMHSMAGDRKAEIVISFLKDHSIRTEWLASNDSIVKVIRSGSLKTNHTEALFTGCRNHKTFSSAFERYISSSFA
jgi:hypothetical protein